MTGISHAITGATIAVVVNEPALALPLAFLSHFVCDAIPHVGMNDEQKRKQKTNFNYIYRIDLLLIILFFIFLFATGASWVVFAGAILAGSPDFVWFYRYIIQEQWVKKRPGPKNTFSRFHTKIQWSETLRLGLPVEIIYSPVLFIILINNL